MKAQKRVLAVLLLIGLSLNCLRICFRPPTPLESALERVLRNPEQGTRTMLTQVHETSPGVVHVLLPVYSLTGDSEEWGWLPLSLMRIWREYPDTPGLLEVTLHPFHAARDLAPVHWTGRRRGQHFQWESSTPVGPRIRVQERWEVTDQNRERVRVQVLRTLQESGFGQYDGDTIGWCGSANCSSKRLIRASDFQTDSLLEVLKRTKGPFDLYLFVGAGHDFVEATEQDLPGWLQQLRTWQWSAQAQLLARKELLEQGMLVDLGWRTFELDRDPDPR